MLKVEGPDSKIPVVTPEELPRDWRIDQEATRDLGTAWLRTKQAVLLQVPSAIVPETANFLFNPRAC